MEHLMKRTRVSIVAVVSFLSLIYYAFDPARSAGNTARAGAGQPDILTSKEQSIQVGAGKRWFLVHRPAPLSPGAPVVILLHGGTGNMNQAFRDVFGQGLAQLSDQNGFLLLIPNGTNANSGNPRGKRQHWNDHRNPSGQSAAPVDDVKFILTLIEWAAETHGIDRSRVFVTGASNGGMMTYRLLIEAPEAFAGGAAFIANLPKATPAEASEGQPVPLMIANGTDDPLMKWEGGLVGARGQQDVVLSAPATRDFWIARNRASGTPDTPRQLPDSAPQDGCHIVVNDYPAEENGARIRFVVMEGGGHTIPSRAGGRKRSAFIERLTGTLCKDTDGADLAWQFFTDS